MNYTSNEQTYYELLEVDTNAAQDEIHRAYKRAKETYSPDSPALYTMFTREEALELSKMIEEAYQVLSNNARRSEYDLALRGGEQPNSRYVAQDAQTSPVDTQNISAYTNHSTEQTPLGHKKTKFGSYHVKHEMEQAIENTLECDGSFLRKVRVYKNITIEQLSEETKISKTYLRSIEDNDYTKLPAPVFVRGFVVQIAKTLGLESQRVAKSFMNMVK